MENATTYEFPSILARARCLFADPEVKDWRARRYEELNEAYRQQQFYDSTEKLINETYDLVAENRRYLRGRPILSKPQKNPHLKEILREEGLPFEIKDGQFNYKGPPEKLHDSSLDLMAALVDCAPEMLEGSIGDIEFLNATVPGFNNAWKKECDRLRKKRILVENRIMRSDGVLTDKGEDMLAELYGDKRAWSFAKDKNAYIMIPILPTLTVLMARNEKEASEMCRKTFDHLFGEERRAAAEARFKEIAGEEDKRPWYRNGLGKAAALASTGLMILGAAAGMVGGDGSPDNTNNFDDYSDTSDTQSRGGINTFLYDYSLPLDQQHPIKPIINTSAKERHPAIYEDQVAFGRYDSDNQTWSIWLKNLTSGSERKLYNDDLYSIDSDNTAIFGNRVVSGYGSLHMHNLKTNKTDYYAFEGFNFDLWGDKLVLQKLHSRNSETGDYKSDVFLHNLTTGNKTKLTNSSYENWQTNPTIYRDLVVWRDGSSYFSMDLKTGEVRKLNLTRSLSSPDLFEDNLVGASFTGDEVFLYNLDTEKTTSFFSSRRYIDSPKIYGDRIVFAETNNISMIELDKWVPQIFFGDEVTAMAERETSFQGVGASHPTASKLTYGVDSSFIQMTSWTGRMSIRPKIEHIGTQYFNITVEDPDGNMVKKEVKLNVVAPPEYEPNGTTEPNQSPTITDLPDRIDMRIWSEHGTGGDPVNGIPHNKIDLIDDFIYLVRASDPDGDNLIYTLSESPDSNFKGRTKLRYGDKKLCMEEGCFEIDDNGRLEATGRFYNKIKYKFNVAVSDGKSTANKTTEVLFKLNQPPEIRDVKTKFVTIGGKEHLELDINAIDRDGDPLTYWANLMGYRKSYTCGESNDSKLICPIDEGPKTKRIEAKVVVDDGLDRTYSETFWINYSKKTEPEPSPWQSAAAWPYWGPLGAIILGIPVATGTYKGVRTWQRSRQERFERMIKNVGGMRWEMEYNGRTEQKRKKVVKRPRKKARKKR